MEQSLGVQSPNAKVTPKNVVLTNAMKHRIQFIIMNMKIVYENIENLFSTQVYHTSTTSAQWEYFIKRKVVEYLSQQQG